MHPADDAGGAEPRAEDASNPFPGLRPFEQSDSRVFFGRDPQVDELLDRLYRSRFVAVVGSSGSGKSSLVQAGLLTALHGGSMAAAGSRWRVVIMRPGSAPVANLAAALDQYGVLESGATEKAIRVGLAQAVLLGGELGLVEIVRQANLRPGENVLLIVDQFEELFRYRQDKDAGAAFVKLLLAAASWHDLPAYVLITMRSDFLGDCSQFRSLPETIGDGLFLVPRLTRDQLREAIEGPVGIAASDISPVLVTQLLNQLGDSPDQLPVLQHALMRAWEIWCKLGERSRPIDEQDFAATGGLELALSSHGDDIFKDLPPALRAVAEKIFRAITDRSSDNRGVRRPTKFAELCAIVGAPREDVREVIERFRGSGRSFIAPPPPAPLTDETVIDISHESLMRIWVRLRDWVDAEAESAQTYRRVADAATMYDKGEGTLLQDPALTIVLTWRQKNEPTAAWAEHYAQGFQRAMHYIDESAEYRERGQKAARTTRRRAAVVAVGLIMVLTLLTAASLIGFIGAQRERIASLASQSRFLARDATTATEQGDAVTGMLLALDALPAQLSRPSRPFVLAAENALERAVGSQTEIRDLGTPNGNGVSKAILTAAYSPDGRRVVTASDDKTARVWDAASGTQLQVLKGHTDAVGSAAFSPDGSRIVTASDDKTARVWDATSGAPLLELRGRFAVVNSAQFSRDGKRIITAHRDSTARVWDARTGVLIRVLRGHRGEVLWASFAADGRRAVTASRDRTAAVWDAVTGTRLRRLLGHGGDVVTAEFSPDGKRVVTASRDKTARVWDAASGTEKFAMLHDGAVYSAQYSEDGKRVVTSSTDGTARLWEAARGAPLLVLRGHGGAVTTAAFSPDQKHVVTSSSDGTARIWNVMVGMPALALRHRGLVYAAAFSPDGSRIGTASSDGTARVCSAATGACSLVLRGHTGAVNWLVFSADGKRLATASDDRTLRLWEARTGAPLLVLRGHESAVNSVAFSPDGKRVVSASDDSTVRVWDVSSGAQIFMARGGAAGISTAMYSPDGQRLVVTPRDSTARVIDASSGVQLLVLHGHDGEVLTAAYSPDGQRLITASRDNTAGVWDATSGRELFSVRHDRDVFGATFSPDGARLATASDDGTARVWDATTGTLLAVVHHGDTVYSAAFSPDGNRLVTASGDRTAAVWLMVPRCQALIDLARRVAPRSLTVGQRSVEHLDETTSEPLSRFFPTGERCS